MRLDREVGGWEYWRRAAGERLIAGLRCAAVLIVLGTRMAFAIDFHEPSRQSTLSSPTSPFAPGNTGARPRTGMANSHDAEATACGYPD